MPITVVSEQSQAEILARRAWEAQEEALAALVKLAGNLLRVIRGSGTLGRHGGAAPGPGAVSP